MRGGSSTSAHPDSHRHRRHAGAGRAYGFGVPSLKTLVPQVGQMPRAAARPFFIVIASASWIYFGERQRMQ
jgi:hypothetical protein